jgi:hypothetical protein
LCLVPDFISSFHEIIEFVPLVLKTTGLMVTLPRVRPESYSLRVLINKTIVSPRTVAVGSQLRLRSSTHIGDPHGTLLRDFGSKQQKHCHRPNREVYERLQDGLTAADGRFNLRFGL